MTEVTVYSESGHITAVTAKGHTGFAEQGEDIVCAALSSIIQTALLGLLTVVGIEVKYDRVEGEDTRLSFSLPQLDKDARHDADVILNTMLCGVSDLYSEYSDFISLEMKN